MSLETRISTGRLEIPIKVSDLAELISHAPADAVLTVTTFHGGSQRDPYAVAYAFIATTGGTK